AVLAPVAFALGWRYRYRLEAALVAGLGPVLARLHGALPWLPLPTPDGIERRVEGFVGAVERVATSPRRLALALCCSAAGWLSQSLGLWIAFRAFGVSIPFYVALFVVPLGTIASAMPTPGGLGAIETVHVLLLSVATSLPASTIAAVVTVHRVGGFLLMTSIGGGSMSYLWATGRRALAD
ncbi:lysylphosphatidylglycerol synthase transmembrane domain-containing protein, partial [Halarchaeum acidiphilum]